MSEMRPAIIKLHEKGYSTREIEQLLDVSQSSVTRHIKRFEETRSQRRNGAMPTANGRPTAPISTRSTTQYGAS